METGQRRRYNSRSNPDDEYTGYHIPKGATVVIIGRYSSTTMYLTSPVSLELSGGSRNQAFRHLNLASVDAFRIDKDHSQFTLPWTEISDGGKDYCLLLDSSTLHM